MKDGRNETVMSFLQGFEVTAVADYEGVTLLHLASACGNADITKYLIKAGYEIDIMDNCGCTPLLFAVRMNRSRIVQLLLNAGANVCCSNFYGVNPLSAAIRKKNNVVNNMIINALVVALAELDMDKESMATMLIKADWSLQFAMKFKNLTLTKMMIEQGADVNFQDSRGKTPLHRAVRNGDYEHVTLLLNHGADINLKDVEGGTALRSVILCSKHPEILRLLMANGANIHDIDKIGKMQCQQIFKYGNERAVKILLNYGADMRVQDCFGDTALHYVACNNDREVIKVLYHSEFLVDGRNLAGQTALHKAAEVGNLNCAKFLLEKGADPNGKDLMGKTPLYFAVKNNDRVWLEVRSDLIRLLFEYGARLSKPIANRHIVKFVVEQGIYPITFSVVEHVAKLESLRVSVDDIDMGAIRAHSAIREYFEDCQKEIADMKARTAFGRITYYNLLCDGITRISAYAGNENFVECYKMVELLNFFPKHSRTIFNKCNMVYEKHKLMENAAAFLSSILPFADSYHLVIRKIIFHLSPEDLRRLAT
jgi:ankyrin repeat protein